MYFGQLKQLTGGGDVTIANKMLQTKPLIFDRILLQYKNNGRIWNELPPINICLRNRSREYIIITKLFEFWLPEKNPHEINTGKRQDKKNLHVIRIPKACPSNWSHIINLRSCKSIFLHIKVWTINILKINWM